MFKRGRLEINHDILLLIQKNKNHIKPTPLLRKSNTSAGRFKEYLSELLEKGFVKKSLEKGKVFIILTDKGFKFLEKYSTILDFIDEFGI
ncbi:winged helix-turn-helix transcriptional regulator [Candidatus Pacearchaeota archaeon]|nr:MAG: hypothetical protein QJ16_C0006G0015 [archaeon GW2011_AR1]MBS3077992.1 winged helix-turn-helix transcriptional regulator [Candidatus Pacearchaeota archaeon]HIH52219.1 winged helix-turn-helix transcriptional regulator [Nanoarchaeota archaeon]